ECVPRPLPRDPLAGGQSAPHRVARSPCLPCQPPYLARRKRNGIVFNSSPLTVGAAIMFEDNVLESRPHALEEIERPQSVPGRAANAKPLNQEIKARAPLPLEDPGEWTDWPAQPEEEEPQLTGKKPGIGVLK